MSRLFLPTVLFVGGVIGLVVLVLRFFNDKDDPMWGAVAVLCIAIGFRELRFELFPEVGEADQR